MFQIYTLFFYFEASYIHITSLQGSLYRWMNKEKYTLYVEGLKQVSNIEWLNFIYNNILINYFNNSKFKCLNFF